MWFCVRSIINLFVSFSFSISTVQKPVVVPQQCEPLNNSSMCQGLGYSFVQLPNHLKYETQKEAEERIKAYTPLVNVDCSPSVRFFLCVLYVPPCVINMDRLILPCREVCEEVKRGCEPTLKGAGYRWPSIMDCKQFPLYSKKGICLKPKAKVKCPKCKYWVALSIYYIHSLNVRYLRKWYIKHERQCFIGISYHREVSWKCDA